MPLQNFAIFFIFASGKIENAMTDSSKDIIIANKIGEVPVTAGGDTYLAHLLCLEGTCRYTFNGTEYELRRGDLSIIRKRENVENVRVSDDFRCRIIYARSAFIDLCATRTNYGIKGSMSLFLNPIIHLSDEQLAVCMRDYDILEARLADTRHLFWRETVTNAMQAVILDFFDFHARIHGDSDITTQQTSIMTRFIEMLDNGTYREHREVSYYADKLCVTPKYLSEISKKVSGFAANYWINRYTALAISRLLRDKSLTFVQISDMFHFSSPAYFSRFVQRTLGLNPTQYRE